jgi:hypothetical protein
MTNDKPQAPSELKLKDAKYWLCEISAAQARLEDWYRKAEEAEDRYKDEKSRGFGALNIFWANVETQKAAIGEEFGQPQVTRVNAPENDGGLSRKVAEVWERSIAAAVRDTDDNHDIALGVYDQFISGRGQVWLELEPHYGDDGRVMWVAAPLVRVPYKDFLHGFATRWGGVPWVARGHNFTRDDLIEQCKLSEEEADQVPMNVCLPHENRGDGGGETKGREQFKRARVWEVWTKYPKKGRLYVAEGHNDKVLCWDADPFRLKHFFPCPRPMIANGDEGWANPLTDYSRYEDQAKELDRISERIYVLTELLRNRGVYDKGVPELGELMRAADNTFLAVDNFAALQAKIGPNGLLPIIALDIAPIAQILAQLHEQRRVLIDLIYELSGISDLARGQTDARETLGAQKLKMSFGAGRFRAREADSRRFAAEAYGLKGELIAEMFPREQLAEMSGLPLPTQAEIDGARKALEDMQQLQQMTQQTGAQMPPPDPKQIKRLQELAGTQHSWEAISKVLHSDYRRCYTVEVETDQTQFVDEEADKAARSEFFTAVMSSFEKVAPMIAGNPKTGEIWKQLIMFVITAFKAGRGLEEGLERTIDEAIAQATQKQGQPPQMDPESQAKMAVAQAGIKTAETRLQTEQVKLRRTQIEAQQAGVKVQEEAQSAQIKAVEGQQKVQTLHDQNQAKRVGHQIDMTNKIEQLKFEDTERATAREMNLRDSDAKEQTRQQKAAAQ